MYDHVVVSNRLQCDLSLIHNVARTHYVTNTPNDELNHRQNIKPDINESYSVSKYRFAVKNRTSFRIKFYC